MCLMYGVIFNEHFVTQSQLSLTVKGIENRSTFAKVRLFSVFFLLTG